MHTLLVIYLVEDNDLPQDDLDDDGALDLDYADTEFKMPLGLKKEPASGSESETIDENVSLLFVLFSFVGLKEI